MPKTYYSLIAKSNILILMIIVVCFLFIGAKSHAATITYTYDSHNRLTRVDYGNGDTIEYTYDAAGNRLTLKASDTTPPGTDSGDTILNSLSCIKEKEIKGQIYFYALDFYRSKEEGMGCSSVLSRPGPSLLCWRWAFTICH
jgi:YD repeat-containing protein